MPERKRPLDTPVTVQVAKSKMILVVPVVDHTKLRPVIENLEPLISVIVPVFRK